MGWLGASSLQVSPLLLEWVQATVCFSLFFSWQWQKPKRTSRDSWDLMEPRLWPEHCPFHATPSASMSHGQAQSQGRKCTSTHDEAMARTWMQAGGMNWSQWLNPPQGDNSLHLVISPPPSPSSTQGEFTSPETSLSSALFSQWIAGYFCLPLPPILPLPSSKFCLGKKKSLLLFLHSISELKSHVMAKFCNRHNQMEEKKGYSFWSEIRQNKQSMSSISTNLWHFWKCHASSLMSPWASSDPANSSLFGFEPQHWARRNFLRFKLLMVLFVFSD